MHDIIQKFASSVTKMTRSPFCPRGGLRFAPGVGQKGEFLIFFFESIYLKNLDLYDYFDSSHTYYVRQSINQQNCIVVHVLVWW